MSEHGEKTEQPTQRRLEDAQKRGQIARSPEVQTVMVLLGALVGLSFFGANTWHEMFTAITATLGHLHLLANFQRDSEPLLSLVLVGLPELHDRLRLGLHRSMLTRIHTKIELAPAEPATTTGYVRKRMGDAGAKGEVFTADGLATLHELTGGLLRSVDVLALASLRLAAATGARLVDREVVRKALHHTPLA